MSKNLQNQLQIERSFKLSKVAVATSAVFFASLSIAQANAQDITAKKDVEVIEVKGIRTSVIASLDVKRESIDIVDAISAEDMGKFPDANLAEALQRIPDISIDRDGGEGRKVTIRGLGPEFNSVLLNGRKVATSEATRAFSFDTIASELVSEMVVYKTQSASLSEGALGGTVDVKTARPLSFSGLTINGSLQGAYEENSEKKNPQASFLISNTFFDDKFGALFGATYQKRENTTYSTNIESIRTEGVFSDQNLSEGAYTNMGYDSVYRPTELNRDVTNDDRTRLGLNGVLQYRPTDALDITVDLLYSKFDVKSEVNRKSNWFWDVQAPDAIEPGSNTTLDKNDVMTNMTHGLNGPSGKSATAFNRRDIYRETETKMFGINIDYMINDDIKLVADAAWSKAVDDNKGKNKRRSTEVFANDAPLGSVFEVDLTQSVPFINNTPEFSANNPDMAKNLQVRRQFNDGNDIEAENYQFSLDLEVNSFADIKIKTGVIYEVSQKSNTEYKTPDAIQTIYHKVDTFFPAGSYDQIVSGIIDVDSSDLGQPGSVDNDILEFDVDAFDAMLNNPENALAAVNGDVNNPAYQAFINNNNSFDATRTGNSFDIEETVTSAYIQGEYFFELVGFESAIIAGVRYTQTDVEATGYSQVLTNLTPYPCPSNQPTTCLDPTYATSNGPGGLTQQNLSSSYSDVLPSATLNINITDDLILRLASSKSLTRPFLEDMAPKFRVGALTEDVRSAEANNENLTPYSSFNLDSSLEWYFSEGSLASFAVYKKTISDFVINETIQDYTVESIGNPDFQDFTVTRPTNGKNDVEITGATFNLTQTFDSGFGYQFNYTKVDTDTEFDADTFDSSKAAIPGLGDSMNLVAFYESGPFAVRVAYNKREAFLRSSQYSSGFGYGEKFEEPVFSDSYDQVDARVSYEILDGTTIFLEGVNLTGSTLNQYGRYDNMFVSYENFGRRYVAGISAKF